MRATLIPVKIQQSKNKWVRIHVHTYWSAPSPRSYIPPHFLLSLPVVHHLGFGCKLRPRMQGCGIELGLNRCGDLGGWLDGKKIMFLQKFLIEWLNCAESVNATLAKHDSPWSLWQQVPTCHSHDLRLYATTSWYTSIYKRRKNFLNTLPFPPSYDN